MGTKTSLPVYLAVMLAGGQMEPLSLHSRAREKGTVTRSVSSLKNWLLSDAASDDVRCGAAAGAVALGVVDHRPAITQGILWSTAAPDLRPPGRSGGFWKKETPIAQASHWSPMQISGHWSELRPSQ